MTDERAIAALNRRFLQELPGEAAPRLEELPPAEAAAVLAAQALPEAVAVWEYLTPAGAEALASHLDPSTRAAMVAGMEPGRAVRFLGGLEPDRRETYLEELAPAARRELRALLAYPEDTAGQMMDTRVTGFPADLATGEALARLRGAAPGTITTLYLVDDQGRLTGRADLQDLALADPARPLKDFSHPTASVSDLDHRQAVVDRLDQLRAPSLPVVDFAGRLVGVLRQTALLSAVQEEAAADLPAMVGASREERALSGSRFAVARRLPWLEINLATAFLAAAVVGLFEGTIARFTALAVLLPVVAGQSGNAGAQALAVTMRGLALREITYRHAWRVAFKEMRVGLLNGLAVAATTAAGVYLWSASAGLALVIALAMVLAMVAAGLAGALIPVILARLGQDPAQSSSIILTTVTDVVGFAAFLGIATLLAGLL